MFRLIKKQTMSPVTLKEHYYRKDRVLIKRRVGGFGDILMQRMMWEDFKLQHIELKFTYACPAKYMDFAQNHPFIKVIKIDDINEKEYGIIYDITNCCCVYESRLGAKNKKHRSDIWANFCGVELKNHNMHLQVDDECKKIVQNGLSELNPNNLPVVLFAPRSTNCDYGIGKSLTHDQIKETTLKLWEMGFFVVSVHNQVIEPLQELGVPQLIRIHPLMWIALTDTVDYVISVDTSTFHLAGGLGKKLVGIFTYTDGKIYGKYYNFALVQKHRDNGDWDCGPCLLNHLCPKTKEKQKPCLTEISSDDIINGLKKLF